MLKHEHQVLLQSCRLRDAESITADIEDLLNFQSAGVDATAYNHDHTA